MLVLAKSNSKISQGGFTLAELMITVSVIGILAALAIPSYSAWIQNNKIRAAAEAIQNGLQKARLEAIKRNQGVIFSVNANSYWQYGCVPPNSAACPAFIEVRLNSEGGQGGNVTVTGGDTAVFTALGTAIAPTAPAVNITTLEITNTALAAAERRPLRVMLAPGGGVRICDPAAGTTDPRRC